MTSFMKGPSVKCLHADGIGCGSLPLGMGTFINYVDKKEGLAQFHRYNIKFCSQLINEGVGGGKNPQNDDVNVVYEWLLM